MKNRYRSHKKACYNSNAKKGYNSKKYLSIRQLGITREDFKDYVKYEILYENIPQGYEKIMENLIIQLYRENGINLWNELNGLKNIDKEKRKYQLKKYSQGEKFKTNQLKYMATEKFRNTRKTYEKTTIQCPQCNLEMNRGSLSRHKRRQHKTI